jgi:hypothetical protein
MENSTPESPQEPDFEKFPLSPQQPDNYPPDSTEEYIPGYIPSTGTPFYNEPNIEKAVPTFDDILTPPPPPGYDSGDASTYLEK